jgi:hypothetical protein
MTAAAGTAVDAKSFVSWSDADGDRVHFTFTDQTASAASGHFRLNGVDQAANLAISLTDTQLLAGALQWVAGQAGASDQIRVVAGDPFGDGAAQTFMTPEMMAGLLAQTPPALGSVPSGNLAALYASEDDRLYLATNS